MSTIATSRLQLGSYTCTASACIVACIAWASMSQWRFTTVSAYTFFPLFGLLAFSILWSQYMVLVFARLRGMGTKNLQQYFSITGWAFLLAIFLHPGLLIWQLWRDGFGLPPESYLRNYIAPGLEWAALLGSISFLIFIAYELQRWYSDRSWWKYMTYLADLATLLIFIHSVKLGGTVQNGWFQIVWIIYGVTLLLALGYLRIYPLLFPTKD